MTFLERLLMNRRRDKRILALAAKGQGSTEIGERLGMSKQRVHQILKKAKQDGAEKVPIRG